MVTGCPELVARTQRTCPLGGHAQPLGPQDRERRGPRTGPSVASGDWHCRTPLSLAACLLRWFWAGTQGGTAGPSQKQLARGLGPAAALLPGGGPRWDLRTCVSGAAAACPWATAENEAVTAGGGRQQAAERAAGTRWIWTFPGLT